MNNKVIFAGVFSVFLFGGVALAADVPPQKPQYVPLNEQQMGAFLNALSEISMPQRAYQQIIGVYKQLQEEAQRGRPEHK